MPLRMYCRQMAFGMYPLYRVRSIPLRLTGGKSIPSRKYLPIYLPFHKQPTPSETENLDKRIVPF